MKTKFITVGGYFKTLEAFDLAYAEAKAQVPQHAVDVGIGGDQDEEIFIQYSVPETKEERELQARVRAKNQALRDHLYNDPRIKREDSK